jgi:hypothetical protein
MASHARAIDALEASHDHPWRSIAESQEEAADEIEQLLALVLELQHWAYKAHMPLELEQRVDKVLKNA